MNKTTFFRKNKFLLSLGHQMSEKQILNLRIWVFLAKMSFFVYLIIFESQKREQQTHLVIQNWLLTCDEQDNSIFGQLNNLF